jgi:hypothetical protein
MLHFLNQLSIKHIPLIFMRRAWRKFVKKNQGDFKEQLQKLERTFRYVGSLLFAHLI